MTSLSHTLDSLHDTDIVVAQLDRLQGGNGQDEILRINREALLKRRIDLERRLGAGLRDEQLDLIEYRIVTERGDGCGIAAVAGALQHFQEIVTAVFDAVRSTPKRAYQPSPENAALSTMVLAAASGGTVRVSLSIPNQRLIAIRSDLDLAFDLVFALFRLRSRNQLIALQPQTGIAALSRLHAWARNSAQHGLTTFVSWQKSADVSESVTLSQGDAFNLEKLVASTYFEQSEKSEHECELIGLNIPLSSFVVRLSTGQEIAGPLRRDFPRGVWTIYAWYVAALTRRVRVHASSGEETTRWILNALTPMAVA